MAAVFRKLPILLTLCLLVPASAAASQSGHADRHAHRASDHAPMGVMGDHLHRKGEVMLSYRFMRMHMDGSRIGTDPVSAVEIATGVANPFFGLPGQPPTLRVAPLRMTMDMHMAGLMYAPGDRMTLMVMGTYVRKDMDHVTFAGPAGTDILGGFTTRSGGPGDTMLSALVRLFDTGRHHLHLNAGLSLPTGELEETGRVLTPTGAQPVVRLPYAMQLGSGTVDLKPGFTYTGTGRDDGISWGAQFTATVRMGENSEDYRLGDRFEGTAWAAWDWSDALSTSVRFAAYTQDSISGFDPLIVGPVQTADPGNYGGDVVTALVGANYLFTEGLLKGNRIAVEAGLPLYRDLNGPQLETDWSVTVGWQRTF